MQAQSSVVETITAFHAAAKAGDLAKTSQMLSSGTVDVDSISMTAGAKRCALHLAAEGGHSAVVTRLLLAGADRELRTSGMRNFTALQISAAEGHAAVTDVLLAAGVEVDAVDDFGMAALHYSALKGHTAVVARLIFSGTTEPAGGATVDARDEYKNTPLILAARFGHTAIVKLLLRAGASVESRDLLGRSALFYSGENGYVDIAGLLIDRGGDFEWDTRLKSSVYSGGPTLVAAGYRNYEKIPKPCPNLEKALLAVWQRHPEDMQQLGVRLERGVQARLQAALLCMQRYAPRLEEKLRIGILHEGMVLGAKGAAGGAGSGSGSGRRGDRRRGS